MGLLRRGGLVALALVLMATLAGTDARASRRCTADEAALALSRSQHVRDPEALQRFYRRFGHCDDGAVAEGASEAVARLLVDHWGEIAALDRLTRSDAGFGRFVFRHIDATLDTENLRRIIHQARHACPPADRRFCVLIERAAIAAEISPAMIRTEIATHGARAVVDRLWNTLSGSVGEGWLAVEQHVASGAEEWLAIAQELAAGTDAGATHGGGCSVVSVRACRGPYGPGPAGDVQRRPSPRRGCGGAEHLEMAHSVIFRRLAESHCQPTSRKSKEAKETAIFRSPNPFSRK